LPGNINKALSSFSSVSFSITWKVYWKCQFQEICWNWNRHNDDGSGGTGKYIHLTITKGNIFNSDII
jgi:hypothetical protein